MFFNRIVAPRFLGRAGDLDAADKAEKEELPPILDYLERVVPDAGSFLVGDTITLANFAHMDVVPAPGRHPRTAAWVGSILARPSFANWVERERAFLQKSAA